MSDMHHDEWRLATFGARITTMFRVISMSARQLWSLIVMVLVLSVVAGWLSGMIETYVNDGRSDWSFVSTLLNILVMIALGVFSFCVCLASAIIAYRTIMQHDVPTWREALSEGIDRLDSVVWVALIYLLPFVAYAVGLLVMLTIVDAAINGFEEISLIMSVVCAATLIGLAIADVYVGFYWLAVIGLQKRGLDALIYSYQLVKGRWRWVLLNKMAVWLVLCLLFLFGLVITYISMFFVDGLSGSLFGIDMFFRSTWVGFGLFNLTVVMTGSAYMIFLIVLHNSLQRESEQRSAPLPTV
jgi:hypothetical protein